MLDRQRDEREASLPDAGPMRIALDGRRILLEQALAAWPRRGTTLVEINCGAGFLQQSLRADGFDVTGCEPSDFLRRRFAEVNGSHFTVEAGHSDLLPFDSESFDWGILHLGECLSPQQIDASLRELLRVVSLGFAITFWNRTSLAGRSASFPPDFPLYPAWSILRRLAWHGLGTFRARSALSGPVSTRRGKILGPCQQAAPPAHRILLCLPRGARSTPSHDNAPPQGKAAEILRGSSGPLRRRKRAVALQGLFGARITGQGPGHMAFSFHAKIILGTLRLSSIRTFLVT